MNFTRGGVDARDRPRHGVDKTDATGLHLAARHARLHDDHMPDGQIARRACASVNRHRRAGVVMHFHPVDANAGKAGDDTHDAGAPHAPGAGNHRFDVHHDAGAPHAARTGLVGCGIGE